jgi:hypothetical protein
MVTVTVYKETFLEICEMFSICPDVWLFSVPVSGIRPVSGRILDTGTKEGRISGSSFIKKEMCFFPEIVSFCCGT